MTLSEPQQQFILHWGEMGSRWGVNRTQAQIHALLYLASEPLDAEAIAATLNLARSNVSTSLKELQAWGLVHLRSTLGDRRDQFVAVQDLWTILRLVMEGRRKRELDPTLQALATCANAARDLPGEEHRRIEAMHAFVQRLMTAFDELQGIAPETLLTLAGMAGQMARVAGKRAP